MILLDGAHHPVDSSEYAFRIASVGAFRESFLNAEPGLLEPIMDVEVTSPTEFQSSIVTLINKRRGQILNSTIDSSIVSIDAEVPLALMFGFSTDLRSVSEGKGEYAMTYKNHRLVPRDRLDQVVEEYRRKDAKKLDK